MAQAEEKVREALMALVARMPYDAISVQGICDEAGLSRKTFSRHFASKEDVVAAQLRADVSDPIDAILDLLPTHEIENSSQILLQVAYRAFYSHRDFYRRAVDSLGVMWLVERYLEVGDLLGRKPYDPDEVADHEMSFAMSFFNGASAIAFKWWYEEGFQTSPDDLAALVVKWAYARFELL